MGEYKGQLEFYTSKEDGKGLCLRLLMDTEVGSVFRGEGKLVKLDKDNKDITQYIFVNPETYGTNNLEFIIPMSNILALNHSDTPNCKISWEKDSNIESIMLFTLTTLKPLSVNEELTIKYVDIKDYKGIIND